MTSSNIHQTASGTNIAQASNGGTALVVTYEYSPPSPVGAATLDAALRRLDEMPLDSIPAASPLPFKSFMPLPSNPLFTGREDDIAWIAETLKASEHPVPVASLCGTGGVGKSQLAIEFVHRYGQFFNGGVYWISFADEDAATLQVAACGGPGVMELRPDFAALDLQDQLQLVLSSWQSPLPRLLVFDNCESEAMLRAYKPPAGGSRILMTTLRFHWEVSLAVRTRELDVLPRMNSISLLSQYAIEPVVSPDTLGAIADEVGDLPLALHLAGSFLNRYGAVLSAERYLDDLRDTGISHRSLEGANPAPTMHVPSIQKTFGITVAQLRAGRDEQQAALRLLGGLSCLAAAQPIPTILLQAFAASADMDGAMRLEDALRELIDLGLLSRLHDASLRLHRLVKAFATAEVQESEDLDRCAGLTLQTFRKLYLPGDPATVHVLEPHLRTVADAMLPRRDDMGAQLANVLGCYLVGAGDYNAAEHYLSLALEIHEVLLGRDHPDTALDLNDLGHALMTTRPFDARALFERAIPLWIQAENWANAAASLDNLGQTLKHAEATAQEAEQYFKTAQKIRETVLGPEHLALAVTKTNLGDVAMGRGEYKRAADYYQRALLIRDKQSDLVGRPVLAKSLVDSGTTSVWLGEPSRALQQFSRALELYREAVGDNDLRTMRIASAVVILLGDDPTGQSATWLPALDQAFEKWCNVRLYDARESTWGFLLWLLGDYSRARRLYMHNLEVNPGDSHSSMLNRIVAQNNLAMLHQRYHEFSSSLPLYESALAQCPQESKEETGLLARLHHNLGSLLVMQQQLEPAAEHLHLAHDLRSALFGDVSPVTASTLRSLALIDVSKGNLGNADTVLKRVRNTVESSGTTSGLEAARYAGDLACVEMARGHWDVADEQLNRALILQRASLAPFHPNIATTCQNLSILDFQRNRYDSAKLWLREATNVLAHHVGVDNPWHQALSASGLAGAVPEPEFAW